MPRSLKITRSEIDFFSLQRFLFSIHFKLYERQLIVSSFRLSNGCSKDQMKKVRKLFVATALSSILAFDGSQRVSCYRQRYARTHAPRYSQELEPGSNETKSIAQTLVDGERGRDWNHSAKLLNVKTNCDAYSPMVSFGLNKNSVSGGFGDRLRGMVTTYYLAIMTNSSFEVHWLHPYNLSEYFVVPSCDDRVGSKEDDVVDRSHHDSNHRSDQKIMRSSIDVWNYFTDALFLKDTGKNLEIITNSFHWKEIVQNQVFKERTASLGLSDMSQAELFKLAIDELLGNPTRIVRGSYASVLRRLAGGYEPKEFGPSYVGVQIRLGGGAVSGWQDPSRHSMDDVQCFAKEAVRVCHLMRIHSIFVTADSESAVRAFEDGVLRNSASQSSPPIVVQVPGVIAHTDRSNVTEEHAKDIWLKSILDWWVLKHASALVVSRSGFGETAAMASDAALALRLKLSFEENILSGAGRGSRKCEFDDVLLRDRDVFQ